MNLMNTMVCWNESGDVALVPWPDKKNISPRFDKSDGACWDLVRDMSLEQRKLHACSIAIKLIVRDKCDTTKVNNVMMGLEEYKDSLPMDMLSAEEREKRIDKEKSEFLK